MNNYDIPLTRQELRALRRCQTESTFGGALLSKPVWAALSAVVDLLKSFG